MAETVPIEYIILFLQSVIVPWLIQVERRLSRIEGYLKRWNSDGG